MIIQSRGNPDPRTAAVIAAYCPCAVSEAAAAFARDAVAGAAPVGAGRAKALLFAASRLAAFAEQVGSELDAQALLCEAVIERFVARGTSGLSPATVRTLRANLRALSRALGAHPEPRPAPLPRERAKAPYSEAEIEGYLRLGACQSTVAARMRCRALICLGVGAGIVAGELRQIRGGDIFEAHGGTLVKVAGARARTVPVRARFAEPLMAAATFAGQGLICGGRNPGRRNITDALTAALCADPGLGRLEAGRLRSTWLHEAAAAIGLQAFMAAAGIRCSQRLGDIAAQLPAMTEREMVALLGGSP